MNRADLVTAISEHGIMTKREAGRALDAVITAVSGALKADGRVDLRGLGVFKVVQRAPKVGRNPRTGAPVRIPARRAVRFKPSTTLAAAIR